MNINLNKEEGIKSISVELSVFELQRLSTLSKALITVPKDESFLKGNILTDLLANAHLASAFLAKIVADTPSSNDVDKALFSLE